MTKKTQIPVSYVIETDVGVPIPVRRGLARVLKEMNVGDSFVFPMEQRNATQTVTSHLKKEGFGEYMVKKVSDTECRVWKVK